MTEPSSSPPTSRPYSAPVGQSSRPQPANLADILERVLDKGIIIAGDIRVNLLDIELLTIKIRLLIVSVDKAQEMGIDWWRNDPMLTTSEQGLADENRKLRERVEELESGPRGKSRG
ncbi:MAG TPA: gas vesicle protein [Nocardioidaceae bacterium]|nr:gas vesicle protein [Nocardioidaceae bacterium]